MKLQYNNSHPGFSSAFLAIGSSELLKRFSSKERFHGESDITRGGQREKSQPPPPQHDHHPTAQTHWCKKQQSWAFRTESEVWSGRRSVNGPCLSLFLSRQGVDLSRTPSLAAAVARESEELLGHLNQHRAGGVSPADTHAWQRSISLSWQIWGR